MQPMHRQTLTTSRGSGNLEFVYGSFRNVKVRVCLILARRRGRDHDQVVAPS
jgi:hypothetical protein